MRIKACNNAWHVGSCISVWVFVFFVLYLAYLIIKSIDSGARMLIQISSLLLSSCVTYKLLDFSVSVSLSAYGGKLYILHRLWELSERECVCVYIYYIHTHTHIHIKHNIMPKTENIVCLLLPYANYKFAYFEFRSIVKD